MRQLVYQDVEDLVRRAVQAQGDVLPFVRVVPHRVPAHLREPGHRFRAPDVFVLDVVLLTKVRSQDPVLLLHLHQLRGFHRVPQHPKVDQ